MVKTEEKLKKEVGELYSFVNIMYADAMSSICQRKSKKPKGLEEERLLEHIENKVTNCAKSYFKDFRIDEKLFKDFNEKQKKHLVNLSKSIDEVEKTAVEDILEEFFTPLSEDEPLDEKIRELENEVEKILNTKNNSIESINRQIGYTMVLYSYENKGYKKYRLRPSADACKDCKEKSQHTYLIDKLKDAEFLPLVHPNCRCTVEILDDRNKAVIAIDSRAIEEQLENAENTKEMGFLDYLSTLLSAAAFIPVIDSFVDLISIPVDLLRGDFVSAGFDLVGILPYVGEVGDAGKALRIADKAGDAAKAVDNAVDVKRIIDIPKPANLKSNGWKDVTPSAMKSNTASRMYKKNDLTIRFDKGVKGASGYKGQDHYHILNPKSTGKHDYYLDINGNAVPKNSKASHIIPYKERENEKF